MVMVTLAVPALGVASRTSYLSDAVRPRFTFAARGARVAGLAVSMFDRQRLRDLVVAGDVDGVVVDGVRAVHGAGA